MAKTYKELVNELLPEVKEIFPWDLKALMDAREDMFLLDIREPYEFEKMKIKGSINVPRGILESACDYDYEETVPELVQSRNRKVIVICRSGNRSVLAAWTMQKMGFTNVLSLKTGVKGWNDSEEPLFDASDKEVPIDTADEYFNKPVGKEKLAPK